MVEFPFELGRVNAASVSVQPLESTFNLIATLEDDAAKLVVVRDKINAQIGEIEELIEVMRNIPPILCYDMSVNRWRTPPEYITHDIRDIEHTALDMLNYFTHWYMGSFSAIKDGITAIDASIRAGDHYSLYESIFRQMRNVASDSPAVNGLEVDYSEEDEEQ